MVDWGMESGKVQGRVGSGLFDTKIAASDNLEHKVADAEGRDLAYLVKNSCMSCSRLLATREIKVVPPKYVQERDRYVRLGAVEKRLMCVSCYNALRTKTRSMIGYSVTPNQRKNSLFSSVINSVLLKQ